MVQSAKKTFICQTSNVKSQIIALFRNHTIFLILYALVYCRHYAHLPPKSISPSVPPHPSKVFSFLEGFFPTNFKLKIVSLLPFASPPLNFKILVLPCLWFPPLIYSIQISPHPKFSTYIYTGLHKRTSDTIST